MCLESVYRTRKEMCTTEPLKGINRRWEEKIYFNTFSRNYIVNSISVIILYINCRHQRAAINMRAIETAFECMITNLESESEHIHDDHGAAVLTRDALFPVLARYGYFHFWYLPILSTDTAIFIAFVHFLYIGYRNQKRMYNVSCLSKG